MPGGRFRVVEIAARTALVTGATGGLGRAIAGALAAKGASLVLSARRQADLEELAASLPGGGHRVVVSDLAEPGAVDALVAEAGPVDILVANAGLHGTGRLADIPEEEIVATLRVNLEASILLARALMEPMQERGEGHLVFISSLSGKVAHPRSSIYNATKFGLRGFALGLMADLKGSPVGASLISPGYVREAGMFATSGAKPPPGIGTVSPQQVADAVVESIEKRRVEIAVAPRRVRMLTHLGLAIPSLSLLIQSSKTGQRSAESLATGHRLRDSKKKAGTKP